MKKKEDVINKPSHYQSPKTMRNGDRLEALDVIKAFDLGFNLGNAIKYICRAGAKGATVQDLKKASYYINDHITDIEAGRVSDSPAPKRRKKRKSWGKNVIAVPVKAHKRRAKKLVGDKKVSKTTEEQRAAWRKAYHAMQARKKKLAA